MKRSLPAWIVPVVGGAAALGGAVYAWRSGILSGDRISPHFTLAELTTTSTGLDNVPTSAELANLVQLAQWVLEPLRELTGPIRINSGFRSETVNEAVGGSSTSDHRHGRAADLSFIEVSSPEAAEILYEAVQDGDISVDQAILYAPDQGGHLHVGYRSPSSNRGQFLYKSASGYTSWKPSGSVA